MAKPTDSSPSIRALLDAATKTRERRKTAPFGWTATFKRNEVTMELKTLDAITQRFVEFTIIATTGEREKLATVTLTSNAWYVTTPAGAVGKFRPYEATFPLAICYPLLQMSELRYVDDETFGTAEILSQTNGITQIALKSGPRVQEILDMLQGSIDVAEQNPELAATPKIQALLAKIKALHDRGIILKVDTATGLLLEYGAAESTLTDFSDFRWATGFPEVLPTPTYDLSQPPKGLGSDELIMAIRFSRGIEDKDRDTFLLDFPNKDYRRIPCLTMSEPGCFLPGRKKVLVHAFSLLAGNVHPVAVDLDSGANVRFGASELHRIGSITSGGSLSPDNRQVALIHQPELAHFEKRRVVIADIETGIARTIFSQGVFTDAHWLESGEALAVERLLPQDSPNKSWPREVGILRLSGAFRKLGSGRSPVVLKGDRILFFDIEAQQWVVVGADGADEKPFPIKLDHTYGRPTLGPERKLMLIPRYSPPPTIGVEIKALKLESEEMHPLLFPAGVWDVPIWAP